MNTLVIHQVYCLTSSILMSLEGRTGLAVTYTILAYAMQGVRLMEESKDHIMHLSKKAGASFRGWTLGCVILMFAWPFIPRKDWH